MMTAGEGLAAPLPLSVGRASPSPEEELVCSLVFDLLKCAYAPW